MRRAGATALLGLALTLFALLFALPSLYVAGVALPLLALTAGGWVWVGGRGSGVELAVAPAAVEEGEPVALVASARLRRWSPAAEIALGGSRAAALPRQAAELRSRASFDRRGRRAVGPALMSMRDPLRLAHRTLASEPATVLVLPRVEPVRVAGSGALDGAGTPLRFATGPELELDALRPHRPGAPASRIHWPTVARTGELVERNLVPDSDVRPLVVLDASRPASEDALDRAVRAAASLCHALALAGGCRLLLAGDRRAMRIGADLRGWPAVHERLAFVEAARTSPRVPRGTAASELFWVTAAGRAAPRELEVARAANRYLVMPGAAEGAAFAVAGCTGVALARRRSRAA